MTHVERAMVDSWLQNAAIVSDLVRVLQPDQLDLKVAEGEFDIAEHLCHLHGTRRFWMAQIDPERIASFDRLYVEHEGDWKAIRDLEVIRGRLPQSAAAVHQLVADLIERGDQSAGPYSHPVLFLQHMMWHEGWHVGAILAALRVNGQELPETWEEPHVWGYWRTEDA